MPSSRTRHHGATIGILVMAILLGGLGIYSYMSFTGQINNNNGLSGNQVVTVSGSRTITGSQSTTTLGYTCSGSAGTTQVSASSSLPIRSTLTKVGADSSLTTLVDNRFVAGTTNGVPALVQQSDTGASTDGTAATGSFPFSIQTGWVEHIGASGAYDIWNNVAASASATTVAGMNVALPAGTTTPPNTVTFGSSIQQGGINVYSLGCYSPSTQIYNWNQVASPIQAPGSGTTATTNVLALVTSSQGTSLTSTASKMPTSSVRWDAYLQIAQTYKGFGYSTWVYGTSGAPVTNYGTLGNPLSGASSYNAPVQVGSYLIITWNQTGLSVTLDSAAASLIPGASIATVNTNKLASGTNAAIVGPLPGCTPASGAVSSTNLYNCMDVPIDIYETATQGTSHIGITFTFVDNQQGGYIYNYLVTPAKTSYTGKGFGAGTNKVTGEQGSGALTGMTFLTPTTGGNAGNPAALVTVDYATVQTY